MKVRRLYLVVLILLEQNLASLFWSGSRKWIVRGGEGGWSLFFLQNMTKSLSCAHLVSVAESSLASAWSVPSSLSSSSSCESSELPYFGGGPLAARGLAVSQTSRKKLVHSKALRINNLVSYSSTTMHASSRADRKK